LLLWLHKQAELVRLVPPLALLVPLYFLPPLPLLLLLPLLPLLPLLVFSLKLQGFFLKH
jgi:hypothetical protein